MKKGKFDYKSGNLLIKPTNEEDVWNCKWDIFYVKDEMTKIGWLSFEGNKETGTVPVTIELLPLYRKRGHATEALKMAREWAFLHPDVYEVEAYAPNSNADIVGSLLRAGFIYRADPSIVKDAPERYSVIRQKTAWLGLYLILGVIAGIILGVVITIPWAGMLIALVLSFALGTYMDNSAKKRRIAVTGGKLEKYKK